MRTTVGVLLVAVLAVLVGARKPAERGGGKVVRPIHVTVATLLAVLLVASQATAAPPPAPPPPNHGGKLLIRCRFDSQTGFKQVDPLVSFGVQTSAHVHQAFGAVGTFGAETVLRDLIYASTSTCNVRSDLSLIWTPTIRVGGGTPVPPVEVQYYLINNGHTIIDPSGIGFLVGRPHNTDPTRGAGAWSCLGGTTRLTPLSRTIPISCPVGTTRIVAQMFSPHCFDGRNFGPGFGGLGGPTDGASHMTTCAATGSLAIPQIQFDVYWPASAAGGRLSSDAPGAAPGTSWHLDYKFGWGFNSQGRLALPRIIDECLNNRADNVGTFSCVVVPKSPGDTAGPGRVMRQDTGAYVTD